MQTSKSPKLTMEQTAVVLLKMGITNNVEFRKLCSQGKRPHEIPSSPHTYYDDFPGWKAFMQLGRNLLESDEVLELKPCYKEIKKATHRLGLSTIEEYKRAILSGRLGKLAPEDPETYFEEQFKGWSDLLAPMHRKIVDFEVAREKARKLWPKNSSEWRIFCRKGERPSYLPAMPDREYAKKGWVSWTNFLNEPEED